MAEHDGEAGAARPRALRAVPGTGGAPDGPADVMRVAPRLEPLGDQPAPRVESLDALLREVDALRSALRHDLALAATAIDSGEPAMAGWLMGAGSEDLHDFTGRAHEHLATAGAAEAAGALAVAVPRRRRHRVLAASPFVAAAAAVIGFVSGVVPQGGVPSPGEERTAALASYSRVYHLAATGASAGEVQAAAQRLHDTLAPLLSQAHADPAAAETAIALLESEQVLLTDSRDHTQLAPALRAARQLVSRLRARLPLLIIPTAAPDAGVPGGGAPQPSARPSSRPTPATSPSARPSSSPSARPTSPPSSRPTARPSSGPTPDHSPSPQPSSSEPNPLHSPVPGVQ